MKLNLDLNNQTKSPVKKSFFKAVAEQTIHELIHELNYDFLKNKNISVSLALVGKEEIKKLNKTYRKKNQVTDVLSFAEYESGRDLRKRFEKEGKNEIFLGELILCYDDIREYATKEKVNPHTKNLNPESFGVGVKLEKELSKVVAHGILHLLGMKHGKKMFGIQEKTIKNLPS